MSNSMHSESIDSVGTLVEKGVSLYEISKFSGTVGMWQDHDSSSYCWLEGAHGGNMYIGDRRVNKVALRDRNISMVFQSCALYPHMKVFNNIAFSSRFVIRRSLRSRNA